MSQLYVDNIKNRTGGAINAPSGIVVSGVGTFSGDVSIGGTLTYEDVKNIDSVGLITARSGVRITDGGLVVTAGVSTFATDASIADKIVHTGDTDTAIRFPAADTFTVETNGNEAFRITSTGGFHFTNAELIEKVNIIAGKLSDNTDIDLDNGMVHYFTTTETSAAVPNITSSVGINTSMSTGDTMSVTIVTTAAAAAFAATFAIDNTQVGVTTFFSGGAPTEGGSSGKDVTVLTIVKTGDAEFDVLASVSNFA